MKFGRMTVLNTFTKNYKKYAECKCACGTIKTVRHDSLKCGYIQSCGCQKKESVSKTHKKNIIGYKFGFLTVKEELPLRSSYGSVIYRCVCSCGTIKDIRGSHLRSGATQSCGCVISRANLKAGNFLRKNNVDFIQEKTFDGCKFKGLLRFDLFLPQYNVAIELDGEQHFKPVGYSKINDKTIKEFKETQIRDSIKNSFCKEKGIELIRIPYWEFGIIEERLLDIINHRERLSEKTLGLNKSEMR